MAEHIDLKNPFIYAVESDIAYGKPVYDVHNMRTNAIIAMIGYYPIWKRYVLYPACEGIVFDAGCLKSLIAFIEKLPIPRPVEVKL